MFMLCERVVYSSGLQCSRRRSVMAKGQEKPKKNNKPKMTVAEKKAKKKEKKK